MFLFKYFLLALEHSQISQWPSTNLPYIHVAQLMFLHELLLLTTLKWAILWVPKLFDFRLYLPQEFSGTRFRFENSWFSKTATRWLMIFSIIYNTFKIALGKYFISNEFIIKTSDCFETFLIPDWRMKKHFEILCWTKFDLKK